MTISPVFILIILACLALSLLAPFLKRLSEPPFKQCPLLNKGEVRLMAALERAVPMVFGPDARVCPQVSYGKSSIVISRTSPSAPIRASLFEAVIDFPFSQGRPALC